MSGRARFAGVGVTPSALRSHLGVWDGLGSRWQDQIGILTRSLPRPRGEEVGEG